MDSTEVNIPQTKQSFTDDDDDSQESDHRPTFENDENEINVLNKLRQPKEKEKPEKVIKKQLIPLLVARVRTSLGLPKPKDCTVLIDTGASGCIVSYKIAKKLRITKETECKWNTAAGIMTTNKRTKLQFMLPELSETKLIEWKMHIVENENMNYDIILGRDILEQLEIIIDFKDKQITWDEISVPMRTKDALKYEGYFIHDSEIIAEATARTTKILDAHYEAADIDEIIATCHNLDDIQKQQLKDLLIEFKDLFDGTLGTWKDQQINIETKEGAKPYHAKAFPIPKSREETLKKEISRLCQIGVLKKVNHSEWAAPAFVIPKKDGSVRFISDFRELNLRIKRKPYPIPKISDLMLKLEGFQYGTSLDLNMGYYHIELNPDSKKLCTIVLPWGKYEYQRLPMGLCNSPDIFQEKMGELMADLEFVRAYIDDLIILTKDTWEHHLEQLKIVFTRLRDAGLKVHAKKSFFGRTELEYLGYYITRDGVKPLPKKVQAILNIKSPTTKKQLRSFIGMVNYYRDMWVRRSEILAPLAALTSKNAPWKWTTIHEKSFQLIKKIMSRETLLAYPQFDQPFIIHTDASHTQLGAVISQENKPIAFYSRKLSPTQTRYTTTERELLAIVETLKEFKNILLGQEIIIYTDHQNLIAKNCTIERVLRWRLLIEEFNPQMKYIPGHTNIVADTLSRLDIEDNFDPEVQNEQLFGLDQDELFHELPKNAYPLQMHTIHSHQQHDKNLIQAAKALPYTLQPFAGGRKTYQMICLNDKIVIPTTLQTHITQWYHTYLCHPGETRTEKTIRQHFTWTNLRNTVHNICQKCDTCQRTKKSIKKYGLLPEKEAEAIPWEKLCVDLIGPYKIKNTTNQQILTLWCLTMIDPATGWIEIREIKNKDASNIANLVEQTWLTRYPWPMELTYDRGTEFMGEFALMIEEDYGIKRKGTTVRNPQANSILERVHQTFGNIIRTFEVHHSEMTSESPWDGILSATMFALRATYHLTLQATPIQLVFGRDAMLNVQFQADWQLIKQLKQKQIHQDNLKENKRRIPHEYKIGDKVLYLIQPKGKYNENPYKGPYEITKINNNGTVQIHKGAIYETVNIRLLKPYIE